MSGPAFLLAYAALAIAANVGLRRFFAWREAQRPAARLLEFAQDPYRIAYLRDGSREALRLVAFSLIDRGLLVEAEGKVQRARDDAASHVRRPVEKALLAACKAKTGVDNVLYHGSVNDALLAYKDELERLGLLAGVDLRAERFMPFFALLVLITGVAAARIQWAFAHGHHNIGFLIVFALVAGIALIVAWRRRSTGLSDIAIDHLQRLFVKLWRNADDLVPGGQSNDAVLTAAIFGAETLPEDRFPYVKRLFPPRRSNSSGDGGGGGDSGSSGSSGCGGGGCGGGCGGCGG